jgi:hypothetical protein
MKDICLKKMYSNIPVLASGCLTMCVYHTKISVSQEIFVKFMSRLATEMKKFRKFPNNSSPVEEE